MVDNTDTLYISHTHLAEWVIRIRFPSFSDSNPVILMLHGWTGDENAMWVFAPRLPENAILIAPRGIYKTPLGGYGWHPHKGKIWPWVDDFQPTIRALLELLQPINFSQFGNFDLGSMHLVGFSQGAALAYTFALFHKQRVSALAGLSGFLPDGFEPYLPGNNFQGLPVFVAHGIQDDIVPVEKARKAVELMDQAGAIVNYCEDDVGHKLSATCFRSMEHFFNEFMGYNQA